MVPSPACSYRTVGGRRIGSNQSEDYRNVIHTHPTAGRLGAARGARCGLFVLQRIASGGQTAPCGIADRDAADVVVAVAVVVADAQAQGEAKAEADAEADIGTAASAVVGTAAAAASAIADQFDPAGQRWRPRRR